ncbi:RagB/SusD family nutrient uptake outer membrane protein [Mucilaginibacter psychrotolerans]|uniref:RagB/SusD family nutrient uptake outer membrane protein n=1 Tax=Mucilaginibacter psychrotolerans TaxID=1524096 RepID=A0A4Y8S3X9_9SPHI|nr:RagB/SusD family nutrient uptake outer membrane protein [Mucilaginibacter psychrotolerans]TFF33658.1 RagB/SusD family nutrient uptake outer membrane protein [Mucilaginibacter psychrotolerans]
MKKTKYLILALSTFALLYNSGCQKQLDIKPQNAVESSVALKTSKDVEGVLIGAYTAAALRGLYGGRFQSTTDFLADDGDFAYFGTFSDYTELNNKAITINNGFVEGVWNTGYNAIGVCNTVLANLNLVDPVKKARVEGEAKFLRGMIYFDLARVFGKAWNDGAPASNLAVPIVLTPTTAIADIQNVKRNTVAEVYAQAIADLQVAETNLTTDKSTYASSGAASAILARIYLTQEKYDLAEAEATKIIGSGTYSLVEHFSDEFQVKEQATRVFNTSEDIFAIQISNQSGYNALNEVYASSAFAGREETYLFGQFFDRFEAGDDRVNEVTDDSFTSKFNNAFGNVVVIRLAEIYLIRAEARIFKSSPDLAGAAADINVVRKRALLDNTTAATAAELLDAVKYERHAELTFEGFQLFDLKRYKGTTYSVDGDGNHLDAFPWNSPKLIFPIPKRERDANPQLTQNEGYQ